MSGLTLAQVKARAVLNGAATFVMLFGGSRSGKTYLIIRNIIMRALKAPGSRHAVLRFRFNHVKNSVVQDTFPKVMRECFPEIPYKIDKTDWFASLPGESQIWFGGLDDKERTEKILGQEYATIYLNEASQIPWSSVSIAITRLAQKVFQNIPWTSATGPILLTPKMYFDCNPPSKAHWSYKLFIDNRDPETRIAIKDPSNYANFQINPQDNVENLTPEYLKTLQSLSARLQKRFLRGEFADATPNQLFHEEWIETHRVLEGTLPEFVRVVVGVDPSGSGDIDNADNDEIGIFVAGLGTDGKAYVLEDCSVKAGPATWGRIATDAFDRHEADLIVGEINYGGAMVQHVIQTARPRTPFTQVTATRGKHIRAEPFSALYEQGKVRHVGNFREAEDELYAFSTVGWTGEGSPNRADALIWCLAELFPGLIRKQVKEERKVVKAPAYQGAEAWMG